MYLHKRDPLAGNKVDPLPERSNLVLEFPALILDDLLFSLDLCGVLLTPSMMLFC